MASVFWFCAILGSSLAAMQFIATILGLGGGDLDGDGVPDSLEMDANADGDSAGDAGGAFLKTLSLRSATAGVAFFGLAGLAGQTLGWSPFASTLLAAGVGCGAIYAVYLLLRMLSGFSEDGSIRESTVGGALGTVYLRIPSRRSGQGKATVTQQGRSMEYLAETDDEDGLPTGTPIVVVKMIAPGTVLVAKR